MSERLSGALGEDFSADQHRKTISRRGFLGHLAEGAAFASVGAAGASAYLKREDLDEAIRRLDGSVYDEYYKYVKGFEPLGIEAYNRSPYLGQVKKESLGPLSKEVDPGNASLRFEIPDSQFVCLKLRGKIDEDYSIGLFTANIDEDHHDKEQLEYIIPVVQTPDLDEQTIYFGYLSPGEHKIDIKSLPNSLYDTSEITGVEVFTVSGNENVSKVLAYLGDVGLREDIVESGKIIKNIPLSTDLRIKRRDDSTKLYEVWTDSSGEIEGKEPSVRISKGDKRLYDREWQFMLMINADGEIEELVYQGKSHSVKTAPLDEPFSLNIDQKNNMYKAPRKTNKVVNIFPFNLLPGSYQDFINLRNPLLVLSGFEELDNGRIKPDNPDLLMSLSGVDNARVLLQRFVEAHGIR